MFVHKNLQNITIVVKILKILIIVQICHAYRENINIKFFFKLLL